MLTRPDFVQLATGGVATFLFWRSAYLTTLFSMRNRTLVATDWLKVKLFGRCVLPRSLLRARALRLTRLLQGREP